MNLLTRPFLWLLLGALMLAVPLSMIARKEYVLSQGEVFRFRLAPMDPTDPFRGRYMTLSFEVERLNYDLPADDGDPGTEQVIYALLGRDEQGFARITRIEARAPESVPYLRITQARGAGTRLRLPFNRFFLNEDAAAAVEAKAGRLLREAREQDKPNPLHAEVRVKDGEGVVTALLGPDGPLTGKDSR